MDKSIDVFNTFLALEEYHKVIIIINPAMIKINVGVGTLLDNIPIEKVFGSNPEACHASNDCQAAIGTPIKLTKSFPANANAKEKVPIAIINL